MEQFTGELSPNGQSKRQLFTNFAQRLSTYAGGKPGLLEEGTEHLSEILAALPITYVATEGGKNQVLYYEPAAETTLAREWGLSEMKRQIITLGEILQPTSQTIENLSETWRSNYHHSRTTFTTSTRCNKRGCTTTTTPHTSYYWAEPDSLTQRGIDHTVINSWSNLANIMSKQADLNKPDTVENAFNINPSGSSIYLKEKSINRGHSNIGIAWNFINGIAYAFYEEADAAIANNQHHEALFNKDSHVKRRSFCKLAGSIFVALGINKLQTFTASGDQDMDKRLREGIQTIANEINTSEDDSIFTAFFGNSPDQILDQLNTIHLTTNNILRDYSIDPKQFEDTTSSWENIGSHLTTLAENTQAALQKFREFINYDDQDKSHKLPAELVKAIKAVHGTNRIKEIFAKEKFGLEVRPYLNAFLTTCGLGLAAFATEKFILPATDRLLEE